MNIKIVLLASLVFFISEFALMLAKRSKVKSDSPNNDKKSLIIFWIVIPLSLSAGFFLADYGVWDKTQQIIGISGLVVFLIGITTRWMAILQLKKAFTVDVAITEGHQLKTDGIYKKIRHPSYLGLVLIALGIAIATNSIFSFFAIMVPFVLAIHYRISVEEKVLVGQFGEEYKEYQSKTKRLIPGIY